MAVLLNSDRGQELGAYKEFEVALKFGETYWKLFKFIVNKVSGDLYMIIPIPEIGLKLSIHSPSPPQYQNIHGHWSSHKLGLHEDVDAGILSEEYWKSLAEDYMRSFRFYEPSSRDEEVLVLPSPLAGVFREEVEGRKEKAIADVGRIIASISTWKFYQTKAKRLPSLISKIEKESHFPVMGDNLGIIAISENKMIFPIDSETMIELDPLAFKGKFEGTSFNAFFNPMQKAIQAISSVNPSAYRRWLPSSDIESFLKETIKTVRQSKFNMVTF